MAFIPRAAFPYPLRTPSWFAGHMSRSLRELPSLLEDIDLVIEARDARLPLTSMNPTFDAFLNRSGRKGKGKEREREKLVVYTKRDLAESIYEEPLRKAFFRHAGQRVMFADTRVDRDVREVLQHAVRIARDNAETMPDMKILVVGMPNVGKSSLLNALRRVGLRKGKAFRTGAEAGITRKLTGTVRIYEDPNVYVYDTPGVMMPFLGKGEEGAERGLKLALTAGIKESLFEQDAMIDYLLWRMNRRLAEEQHFAQDDPSRHPTYLDLLPLPTTFTEPTDSLPVFLDAVADRLGALKRGGERDHDAAMGAVIRAFREGKLGRWTLDELVSLKTTQSSGPVDDIDTLGTTTVDTEANQTRTDIEERSRLNPTNDSVHPSDSSEESSELDWTVSNTVQHFLAQHSSSDTPSTSLNQKRKAEKRQKLEERDAKLRAKGVKVKPRVERPGLWDTGRGGARGLRLGLGRGSRSGEAGRIARARRARD